MMPTFRYDRMTNTTWAVLDAHTGEAYGLVIIDPMAGIYAKAAGSHLGRFPTRDDAARALYAARHAHGFEAGAL
jgi:hypothetical protein